MATRIPPLLEPYLALPDEASLILLTNVLGATSNWLVLRYLYSILKNQDDGENAGVVLVSFMRDSTFWREGAGRMGLDVDHMNANGRFVFVDGLSGQISGTNTTGKKERVLRSTRVNDVERDIGQSLGELRTQKRVLIVDQIDALLAISDDDATSSKLSSMILSLRERAHSTILTLSADSPLVHSQTTMLEREHAALALGQAHGADRVLSLRMLDTGTAKDVSGVMRITSNIEGEEGGREYLYFVASDGSVKVFERGT
ncbi:unnamed protein product [Clonostachys byssicola]|uniref:Elongator complex protein 6 n=1 Tax=Clonostachys byssicola TaxID=160290 RepID=A0A9N9UM86_9HYPO|nr:unnamed protein product [Clonostachys byssicola]